MPTRFELPSLAQKDYAQLFSQLRQSIPRYASRWTDFNESDPGITLLQLLSWLGDVTLYRADTLPRGLDLDFARLILGAGFDAVEDLIETLQRDVVVDRRGSPIYLGDDPLVKDPARLKLALLVQQAQSPDGGAGTISSGALRTACLDYLTRSPYRAVTAEDYSQIAISMTEGVDAQDNPYQKIARAEPVFGEGRVRLLLIAAAKPDYSVRYSSLDKTARIKQTITAKVSTGSLPYPRTQLDKVCAMAAQYFAPRIILGTALEVRTAEVRDTREAEPLDLALLDGGLRPAPDRAREGGHRVLREAEGLAHLAHGRAGAIGDDRGGQRRAPARAGGRRETDPPRPAR